MKRQEKAGLSVHKFDLGEKLPRNEVKMVYKIETQCIHGKEGKIKAHSMGAISMPIYQTATFAHLGIGNSTGYDYSRESNPTRSEEHTSELQSLA